MNTPSVSAPKPSDKASTEPTSIERASIERASIESNDTYDAIIIGSGMGGLTTAALLSKLFKKKVLVLEQHFKAGGFTHDFQRKGKFNWDVGLHYVGEMAPGSLARSFFDYLSDGKLRWQKMPDIFEKFIYPDFDFAVSSNPQQYLADLIDQFPQEEFAIRQYFKDVEKASSWVVTHSFLEVVPGFFRGLVKALISRDETLAKETTQHYLARNFKDARLKSLLTSQWGDYGLPPSKSSFGIHSVVVSHYLQGAWYPVGGGGEIAKAIIPTIERSGGAVMTRRKVTEILVANGKVKGVKVQKVSGQNSGAKSLNPTAETISYHAPIVISDAGAYNTFLNLIPESVPLPETNLMHSLRQQEQAQGIKQSMILTLYLGLKESPQKLGFQGENHWIYETYDHEHVDSFDRFKETDSAGNSEMFSSVFSSCYLTFPSLKDPTAKGSTAEIIVGADYSFFEPWGTRDWKKRGDQYESLKQTISETLIQFVEKHYPGFQSLIDYQELATPLTFQHFANNQQGEIYGVPFTPSRLDQTWTKSNTSIKNLYLTGADTFCPGVVGAMWGGTKAAGLAKGMLGFPRVMLAVLAAQYR